MLEAKNLGVPLKQGQLWTFNALRNTGLFTIVIIWGERNRPEEMQILYPLPLQVGIKKKATLTDLRRVVKWWFTYVEKAKNANN